MPEPASASTFPRADTDIGPKRMRPSSGETWFRTREGRRYGRELGLIIVAKLILLVVLWLVLIELWPRAPTPPAAVVQHIYLPVVPAARRD